MKPTDYPPRSWSSFACRAVLMALGLAAAVGLPNRAAAQTTNLLFMDDFEAGTMVIWTVTPGASALDISVVTNAVPVGGQFSAYLNSSLDRMYRDLQTEVVGWSVFRFYLYDSTATRAFGEVRGYSGAGYNQGTLQNLYAIGKYISVTMPGEVYDATKYQGRVALGPGSNGWFNLNGPGAPSRSPGWHRFDIVRTAGGDYNFYVDGTLGRSLTGVTDYTWDSIAIGSVAAGSTAGHAWFDGVLIGTIEPPPGPLTITGIVPSTLGGAYDITYTNGSGSQFILLTAPQVTEPITNWVPVATNTASSGTFSVVPTANTFYRIQTR